MTAAAPVEFRHGSFQQVRRWGPTVAERVHGSSRLRGWQRFARGMCAALGQLQVTGWLPAEGPLILACNHTSAMDGALLFALVERPVSFLVKAEAFQPVGGLAGLVLIQGAQLPVRRDQIDPAPVRLALHLLEQGGVVGICPEGSRGDGRVATARPGVGYLAVRTGAPIVPVAIHGSSAMAHRRGRQRPGVRLSFGSPMSFPAAGPGPLNRRQWLAATEQIRVRLADLVRSTEPNSGHREPPVEKVN